MQNITPITPDASADLVNIAHLCAQLGGLHRPRIYNLIKTAGFPRPLKLGKTSRWRKVDVDAWLRKQAVAQGLEAA